MYATKVGLVRTISSSSSSSMEIARLVVLLPETATTLPSASSSGSMGGFTSVSSSMGKAPITSAAAMRIFPISLLPFLIVKPGFSCTLLRSEDDAVGLTDANMSSIVSKTCPMSWRFPFASSSCRQSRNFCLVCRPPHSAWISTKDSFHSGYKSLLMTADRKTVSHTRARARHRCSSKKGSLLLSMPKPRSILTRFQPRN
mmetsp:Transcript_16143/g.30737  ORF Transcript_16143/g.30737 Transcript_16143/m.30737 type:complete len:200 (+) Transcript_16143:2079-2678(+)